MGPELAIPPPQFLFEPGAVAATLTSRPALQAVLANPEREGEPSAAFAGVRKTPRQIYRALVYHEEVPALAELLDRVDHWLGKGWPATKLRGRDRAQFRSALAELEVADHFEARDLTVGPAEPDAPGGSVADMVVSGDDVRAVVEVHSPVEWDGLTAFQDEAWDTLRNLDVPYYFHFDLNARQRQPVGERGYAPLHPELLSRALADPAERVRVLRPLVAELLEPLSRDDQSDVAVRHDDEALDLTIEIELSYIQPIEQLVARSGTWGLGGLGGYRPELMFDDIIERIGRKARRRQAQSEDALEVVVVDMSRSELQSELTHETYYRPRFADALRQRFANDADLPCDIVALCQSRGWRKGLTTYFLLSRDATAQAAAERLFGPLAPVS